MNERRQYFEAEGYLSFEAGYPERDVNWFRKHLLPDVLAEVFGHSQKSLLDVGCASGYFTRILASEFFYTEGIDFVAKRIEYAKQFETPELHFSQVDVTQPFDLKRQFDVLFTNAVIPHIPLASKVAVFNNLARVAAPKATMLMYDGKTTSEVIDTFVGILSSEWLAENVKTWRLVSCEFLTIETFRYVLIKV